jgi:exodeoxyribonuclease V alpha subunit
MRCVYERTFYENHDNGYSVVCYATEDPSVPPAARSKYSSGNIIRFTAVGYRLPATDAVDVELDGKWETGKYGMQFAVENFVELIPHTKEGIIGYLSSGLIKGIGPGIAKSIVAKFGLNALDILDNNPDRLVEIRGISTQKLEKIKAFYSESRAIRDIVTYLSPFGITVRKAIKIHNEFGGQTMDVLKTRPFELCTISGFGFKTVDAIARKSACSLNDPMRIRGAALFILDESMSAGHLYLFKTELRDKALTLLNDGYPQTVVTQSEVNAELLMMVSSGKLLAEDGNVYKPDNLYAESDAANRISKLLNEKPPNLQIEKELLKVQADLSITLSLKQAEAVKNCFAHNLSIITGGPGTGKTTVLKVVLEVYKRVCKSNVLLAAPTGRAARRMAESTGYSHASTLHSALGLTSDDYGVSSEPLETDFVIVDEFSMVDMRLARQLFCRIRTGTKVLLVGDADQLPSIGAGNVFRELIGCGCIPVTVLDVIYRQAEVSRIAINAHHINKGIIWERDALNIRKSLLQYGDDFEFIPCETADAAARIVERLYVGEISEHGIENVQILSPFRSRTEACVDALNKDIRELVNPQSALATELKIGKRVYRLGDRVMQVKNRGDVSNGDVGIITAVNVSDDNDPTVTITFSDERVAEYAAEDLDIIELAYAMTIHKSQGSEYHTVIIPLLKSFYVMLRRNLIYTAITRAKKRVILVGERQALYTAVGRNDIDRRNTLLGQRIQNSLHRLSARPKKEPEPKQLRFTS